MKMSTIRYLFILLACGICYSLLGGQPGCETTCTDNDADGFAIEGGECGPIDCDDANPDVNPGVTEACDNDIDDDCDGQIDVDDSDCLCSDLDMDGYGDPATPLCTYSEWDCDDHDSSVHPDAPELCDGIDNNCDGQIDEECGYDVITVLTINLQNPFMNPGEVEERTRMVADLILQVEPDFVALQEAAQTLFIENRAQVLADLTGYNWIWEMTHSIPLLFEEGICILTPWPIVWSDIAWLPHKDLLGLVNRAVLAVEAVTSAGDIQMFCSHMTIRESETIKADQAVTALDFIESRPSDLPGFFAGDLNAEPDSIAMRVLRGEEYYEGYLGNLTDAWIEAHGADPGYTYPAQNPEKRIDYIYTIPGSDVTAEVLICEHVFDEPAEGIWASDHIGLLCRFMVP